MQTSIAYAVRRAITAAQFRELPARSFAAGGCRLIPLAAPKAAAYYPHIGLRQHPPAWTLDSGELD